MASGDNDNTIPVDGACDEDDVLNEEDIAEVIYLDKGDEEDEDSSSMLADSEQLMGNSNLVFLKHEKSVFTCDIHPNMDLAISGGEDDKVYIWNITSGCVLKECSDFKDSVVRVAFSKDGTFVAAADMSGFLKVWKFSNGSSIVLVWEFQTGGDITWMDWHYGVKNALLAGTVESELWMWKIPSGESKIFMGQGEKVEYAQLLKDGKRVAVGYGDGTIRLFDLKTGNLLKNVTDSRASHSPFAITTLCTRSDSSVICSGGSDGLAKLLNVNTGRNIGVLSTDKLNNKKDDETKDSESRSSVESTLFVPHDNNLLITGNLDGLLTAWDISTQVSRHSLQLGGGIVKIEWRKPIDQRRTHFFVASLDGSVKLLDANTFCVISTCIGHSAAILDFAQSSDGNVLLTASDDGQCRIFNIENLLSD